MTDTVYVTYNPPEGAAKVCEMGGKTFYAGVATELDKETDAALIEQCEANSHFETGATKAGVKAQAHDPDGKPATGGTPHVSHNKERGA